MYTPEQRALLRSALLDRAVRDTRISGAAITGSGAAEREDEWSDIDLAFGVGEANELPDALSDWTAHMYDQHQALHHLDIRSGVWIYRVFLLPSTLQVDLAFVPASEFRPLAPSFRLVFGSSNEERSFPPPVPGDIIGLGWLYGLHARTSIARGKLWQAEYMISGIRDHALALACLRHGLPAVHGRGIDQLPNDLTSRFEDCLVRQVSTTELARAFRAVMEEFVREIRCADQGLAGRLEETLVRLRNTAILDPE